MKPRAFIAVPLPREAEDYLARHCPYKKWEGEGAIPRDRLLQEVSGMEGLLVMGHWINQELLDRAPRLKIVSNIGAGYNNFDLAAMKARGVMGTNTPGVMNETVADLVFGLILAAARRIPELDRLVKEGGWKKGMGSELFGVEVHHSTLGIIGLGRIGEAIARRAVYGFGMKLLYHNRQRRPELEEKLGAVYLSLDDLLKEADFVVVMTPLTPQTRGFIGYRELCLMKRSAVFINASRGGTVDEAALARVLEEGRIYAAGLDVYGKEPVVPENPLLKTKNAITLPHIGAATEKARLAMSMLAVENLVKGLSGEQPPNLVEELK
ncbi:MAG: D-glycerate dehydrogenase [Peptococcaceae bacterium]|jgi:gluconate 2-dehydrogenase|nr:D-glycerate dehydrogenase [Peptococcaceae bacterium]MDH7523762.1 D-glycerate dehydrogenase [Peptococcaceae bacterium]